MAHYLLELAIWLLAVFLLGCLAGTILRRVFARPASEVAAARGEDMLASGAVAEPIEDGDGPLPGHAPMAPRWTVQGDNEEPVAVGEAPAPAASAAILLADEPAAAPRMPVGISGPRAGRPDALQRISGVGPKNEQILHSLGFYHFDQIAQWTEQHVEWVDGYLRFNGRIHRENWVEQCRLLADGEEAEFLRLFGTGGMRDPDGHSMAGDRTRQS